MVTIEDVRNILGEEVKLLTDQQIEEMISVYSMYSRFMIAQYMADKRILMKDFFSVEKKYN